MGIPNGIALPPQQPLAVITVVLLPGGQVTVSAQGQINEFVVNGAMESGRQLLLAQIEKAAQGPKVEEAPKGLRF
jgi:hypothetical protein